VIAFWPPPPVALLVPGCCSEIERSGIFSPGSVLEKETGEKDRKLLAELLALDFSVVICAYLGVSSGVVKKGVPVEMTEGDDVAAEALLGDDMGAWGDREAECCFGEVLVLVGAFFCDIPAVLALPPRLIMLFILVTLLSLVGVVD